MSLRTFSSLSIIALTVGTGSVAAQQTGRTPSPAPVAVSRPAATASTPLPPGYVIGANDILSINFWRDKDLSADVTVRPDGKITLPLLNEINALGLTPEELRRTLVEAAGKFIEDPDVTVGVKEIRSRIVFITGNVAKPANYALTGEMTVLQLIAVAGGLLEYADSKNIVVVRPENGRTQYHKFNYKDVVSQKRPAQNIELKPGDTVVVP